MVNILALETSEQRGSLAAACDDKLLLGIELDHDVRSAQSFASGIKRLLAEVGWKPTQIDLVAVTVGPGSFTGLRVGVVAAKTLAYAARAEILGVNTLEVIAAAAPADVQSLSVAVDSQRGQVAAETFWRVQTGWFQSAGLWTVLDIDAWLSGLAPGTHLSGPVLRKIAGRVPEYLKTVDPRHWPPSAVMVARLAARDYLAGRRDDLWTLTPRYSRPSAAEERLRGKATNDESQVTKAK